MTTTKQTTATTADTTMAMILVRPRPLELGLAVGDTGAKTSPVENEREKGDALQFCFAEHFRAKNTVYLNKTKDGTS